MHMNDHPQTFLGTGWTFPPAFDRIANGAQMSSDIKDIDESIRIILSTTPGERIMQPEFGCNINRFVFDGVSTTFLTRMNHEVRLALSNYEPRIEFLNLTVVEYRAEEGLMRISINYSIITTNTRHNLVYPFYLIEGTNAGF